MRTLFEQYLGKRKTDIIIAVLELADSYGIRGITTKKIAEKVGFVEGALYKHIDSKHEAFSIILDFFEELLAARFKLINENEMKADDALREWFFYALQVLEKYPGIYRILFSDELYIESKDIFSKFKDIIISMTTEIRKLLEKGIVDGIFRENLKTEIVPIGYLGVLQTVFTFWNVVEERKKGIFELAEPIFADFMNSIRAKEK
ncbi:MAG: TetR/AcrR family transcriptional regulator [Candidatus Aminicenantes bacterium]|nr:TetR/AcrR family transcriptional regulator [Candidatus Aminicenantes bacterium]